MISTLLTTALLCFYPDGSPDDWIHVRLSEGHIVPWDSHHWAEAPEESLMAVFAGPSDFGTVPLLESVRTSQGFAVLKFHTPDITHTLGVNLAEGRGFYTYRPVGLSTGSFRRALACEPLDAPR
jgi:hypothetical protein